MDPGDGAGVALAAGSGDLCTAPGPGAGLADVDAGIVGHVGGELGHGAVADGATPRGRDQLGDPGVLAGGQADVEVGAEGLGDLLPEDGPEGAAGDAADHLAHQVALGQGMIAGGRSRLPEGRLGGEQGGDLVPVVEVGLGQGLLPAGEAGGMGHELSDGDGGFAVLGELRPVLRHRGVEVEISAVGQQEGGEGGHGLGRGVDVDQGVRLPGPGLAGVGEPAPEVDHHLPLESGGEAGADVEAGLEVAGEGAAHGLETGIAGPVNLNGHDVSPPGQRSVPPGNRFDRPSRRRPAGRAEESGCGAGDPLRPGALPRSTSPLGEELESQLLHLRGSCRRSRLRESTVPQLTPSGPPCGPPPPWGRN